jgi:hypothetical protein
LEGGDRGPERRAMMMAESGWCGFGRGHHRHVRWRFIAGGGGRLC